MNFSAVTNYGVFLLLTCFDDKCTSAEFRSCFLITYFFTMLLLTISNRNEYQEHFLGVKAAGA